jgi:serine/threonine protein kinase
MSFCPACQSDYPDDWKRCPKDEATLLPRRTIGKYEITEIIGLGGMGAVYRATNPDTKAGVAIKLLHPSSQGDDASRARFKREAASVAALNTRHVIKIFDFGSEDEILFLVMELLEGHNLRHELRQTKGAISLQRVNMAMTGSLRGLAAAHRAGVTHRDLKPENIFVADTDDGEYSKVLDFGIARLSSDDSNITHSGALMGTPAYMAPEQVSGKRGQIGSWSDCYGMGVILYELLVGEVPFKADSVTAVLSRVIAREYEPLTTRRGKLPKAVYQLVERSLREDPTERFKDASEMADAWDEAYRSFGSKIITAPIPKFVPAEQPEEQIDPNSETDLAISGTAPTQTGHARARRAASPLAHPVDGRKHVVILGALVAAATIAGVAFVLWPSGDPVPVVSYDAEAPAPPNDAAASADAIPLFPTDMVKLSGGAFTLGAEFERFRDFDEASPARTVQISPFALDRTEAAGENGLPLRNLSWQAALRYCEERGKRLPTEAEWEFAATRGKLDPMGAQFRTSGKPASPAKVGSHPGDCTPEGVCDLLGNVSEWTADPWPSDASARIVRGGSFAVSPQQRFWTTPYARTKLAADTGDAEIGFRCARDE